MCRVCAVFWHTIFCTRTWKQICVAESSICRSGDVPRALLHAKTVTKFSKLSQTHGLQHFEKGTRLWWVRFLVKGLQSASKHSLDNCGVLRPSALSSGICKDTEKIVLHRHFNGTSAITSLKLCWTLEPLVLHMLGQLYAIVYSHAHRRTSSLTISTQNHHSSYFVDIINITAIVDVHRILDPTILANGDTSHPLGKITSRIHLFNCKATFICMVVDLTKEFDSILGFAWV